MQNFWGREAVSLTEIQARLFALQDVPYREFHSKLIPTVDPGTVIGVRVPKLRALAKELLQSGEAEAFLDALPHCYYDENILHSLILSQLADYETALARVEAFLPYIDNWAVCDVPAPKCFHAHLPELLPQVRRWVASDRPYVIRYGIGVLLQFYLDESFQVEFLDWAAAVRSEEYYVNMMVAWYFATALAKHYDAALPYLEAHRLPRWTHNKTIQKAIESYRITPEQKAYLRTLRVK